MESYAERLEREIKEMQVAHPGLKEMMDEIKAARSMSNMEIDYDVERDARAYEAVRKFLISLNLHVSRCSNCGVPEMAHGKTSCGWQNASPLILPNEATISTLTANAEENEKRWEWLIKTVSNLNFG